MEMLVDSHCHLDFPDFAEELDDVVQRARDVGIGRMVTICTRVRKFDQVLAVAERFDDARPKPSPSQSRSALQKNRPD